MKELSSEQIKRKVLEVLQRNAEGVNNDEILMDTRLIDLGINSFKAIQVLIDLEETLEMQFPDNMLVPEIFETSSSLIRAIQDSFN